MLESARDHSSVYTRGSPGCSGCERAGDAGDQRSDLFRRGKPFDQGRGADPFEKLLLGLVKVGI